MIKRQQQFRRLLVLLALVCAAFAGLGYRLVDLQVLRHDELAKLAEDNTQRRILAGARSRGDILDANGNLLATSVPVKTVCADPSLIGDQQAAVAHALAPLLQMSEGEICSKHCSRASEKIQMAKRSRTIFITSGSKKMSRTKRGKKFRLAMSQLSSGVDEKKMTRSRPRDFCRQSAAIRDFRRAGPDARLSERRAGGARAGFFGTQEFKRTAILPKLFGCDGIEKSFNAKLSGASGWRVTGVDSRQKRIGRVAR